MTPILRLLILARVCVCSIPIDWGEVYDNTFDTQAATGQLMQEVLDVVGGTFSWAYIIAAPSHAAKTGNTHLIESYDGAFATNDGLANYAQNVADFVASAVAWTVIISSGAVVQQGARSKAETNQYIHSEGVVNLENLGNVENYDYTEDGDAGERSLVRRSAETFDFSQVILGAFSRENCIANWIQNLVNFLASTTIWLILVLADIPSLLNVNDNARKKREVDQHDNSWGLNTEKVDWLFNKLTQSIEEYNTRFPDEL